MPMEKQKNVVRVTVRTIKLTVILLLVCWSWNFFECLLNSPNDIQIKMIITIKSFIFSILVSLILNVKSMKRNILNVLLIMVITLFYSCSNEEIINESKITVIEKQFNEKKRSTIAHNTMLENTYLSFIKSPINIRNITNENDEELDAFIYRFIESNDEYLATSCKTRGNVGNEDVFSFFKQIIQQSNLKAEVRSSNSSEMKMPDFMNMFLDNFFNGEDFNNIDVDKLNEELLSNIWKVLEKFPNLTEKEVDGLLFVAGVTYNSCIYWSENSIKWAAELNDNATRGNIVWESISNGVKKWALADGTGAAQAWLANELLGVASGGLSLLAGAAVSSAWGAVENAQTL